MWALVSRVYWLACGSVAAGWRICDGRAEQIVPELLNHGCSCKQAELYIGIGEEDILVGLWKRRCRTEDMQWPSGTHIILNQMFLQTGQLYVGIGEQDIMAGLWKRRCRTENTQGPCRTQKNSQLLNHRCSCTQAELYVGIGEEDILAGLWKRRCRTEDTRAGMALMQTGLLPAAQDIFLDACKKGWQENSALPLPPAILQSPAFPLCRCCICDDSPGSASADIAVWGPSRDWRRVLRRDAFCSMIELAL